MLGFVKNRGMGLAVLAAVLSVGGLASAVRADQLVQYYTTGSFSDTSGGGGGAIGIVNGDGTTTFASTLTLTNSGFGNSVTLTYSFQNSSVIPNLVNLIGGAHAILNDAPMGNFSISTTTGTRGTARSGLTFTLNIFQVSPVVGGTATFLGSDTVSVSISSATGTADVFFNTPLSGTRQIASTPPIVYEIEGPDTSVTGESPDYYLATDGTAPTSEVLRANLSTGVSAVAPLPAMASMGMTMFGLLGVGLIGRKIARRSPVAAN